MMRVLIFLFFLAHVTLAQRLGTLPGGGDIRFVKQGGTYGLVVTQNGKTTWQQPAPIRIYERATANTPADTAQVRAVGYASVRVSGQTATATGKVWSGANGAVEYRVTDTYRLDGAELRVKRSLKVIGEGTRQHGFVSALTLETPAPIARTDSKLFLPGNVYGTTENLQDAAIGGADTYLKGNGLVQIREDRLPTPMADVQLPGGTYLTVLNPRPDGRTTNADSEDFRSPQQTDGPEQKKNEATTTVLTDERFQFGAMRVHHGWRSLDVGYVFPGSEGEVTYKGIVYPLAGSRQWRWRLHPIKNGLTQQYELIFRFAATQTDYPAHLAETGQWAWRTMKPQLVRHNITQLRGILSDFLVKRVAQAPDGRWGFPYLVDGFANYKYIMSDAVMGFCGKNIETAYYLIEESERTGKPPYREVAEKVINSFTPIKMDPPAAEGFDLLTGKPMVTMFYEGNEIYLRPLTDDFKMMANLLLAERKRGREHPNGPTSRWMAWAKSFADWLLTQQRPDGGLPRKWEPVTGRVVMDAPQSSYNAVPFLVKMTQLTNDTTYLSAAKRIGRFSWETGHNRGLFVGGTIDNPNVIDKEAGTLSTEAYLALYEATKDKTWLSHAEASANYAATWIYLWNVPIPADADAAKLGVKPNVPSTGFQLISTGHSLADAYMTFDVDEYAKLYRYTGKPYYREVARLLLHNTKSLIALPEHKYDLPDLGYQQEHFGFGPARGQGMHRWWLPWVTTSHLNGIVGLEQFDKALYDELR